MNVLEILILITTVISAANLVIFKRIRFRLVFPASAFIFSIINLFIYGYRIQMVPAYIIALLLLLLNIWIKYKGSFVIKKMIKIPAIFLLILSLIIMIAFPAIFPVVQLPEPDGGYSVGTMYMSFTDESRKGIFTAEDQSREIAVQIWYPADDTADKEVINFFPDSVLSTYMADRLGLPDVFNHFSLVKTHSFLNANLSNRENRYPVILFSNGYGSFVGQNTVLMETLASNGYIVFGISHPYENFACIYPNGEILRFNTEQVNRFQNELLTVSEGYSGDRSSADFVRYSIEKCEIAYKSVHIWSDDTIFIADQIEKMNVGEIDSMFGNKLDISNMGVFGHSFGGATAGQTCLEDSRFKAFINMDGTAFGDTLYKVIDQPFMIMNGDYDKNLIKEGYSDEQTNYIVVTIDGAKHADFMDFTVLLPSFRVIGMLGNIGGSRQEEIMNDYVLAFFNKYLKGLTEPLIDEKVQIYDEVSIEYK